MSKQELMGTVARSACTIACVVGLFALVYGLWLAWRPLGWISGGAILVITGYGGYRQMSIEQRIGRRR